MSTPLIEVKDLVNRFGAQTVHDGVNLTIFEREIIGIVGGSGTGKSVLLPSILGLHSPTAGEIRVFGRDIACREYLLERRF